MTALDLSTALALTALGLLMLNMCFGIVLTVPKSQPSQFLFSKHLPVLKLHNWTAYTALVLAMGHMLSLLFVEERIYSVVDILLPFTSEDSFQPIRASLGATGFYALLVVIITSYFRKQMKRNVWKKIHFLSYGVAVSISFHGLFMDTTLKGKDIDWIDVEKIMSEACILLLIALVAFRLKERKAPFKSAGKA